MNSHQNITSAEWDLIETWMDQNDVPGEAPLLKGELSQIPGVLRKIEDVKKVREEIEDSIRRAKIKAFHLSLYANEEDSSTKKIANKKISSSAIWFALAASVAVLFGIFWMTDHSNYSEKIFAKNFKPDIGLPLKMNTDNSSGFYEGMLNYKQENYKEAIKKWEILLRANPGSDTLNYFLGVTNLAMGNSAKSLEYLQNQELFKQGIFKEDAAWYAALAKIKEGKFEEAKAFLKDNQSVRNENLMKELEN